MNGPGTLIRLGLVGMLSVGCGPNVEAEEEQDPRILETCTDYCEMHESCGKRRSDCMSVCTESDSMRTHHCRDERLEYMQCLADETTCDIWEAVFVLGEDLDRGGICRDLDSAHSRCVGRNRPAINEELDK